MKIIIVDDHKLLRDCLVLLMRETTNIEIVGEVSNGKELLEIFPLNKPDIVLLDINMPIMDGVETLTHLVNLYDFRNVIALSMLECPVTIKEFMRLGARGFLSKNCDKDELLHALRMVNSGGKFISPSIILNLLDDKNLPSGESQGKHFQGISKKELEVLKLIADGLTNSEIAEKLFNSRRTIESHRRSLIEKTGSKNTAELIKYAASKGILT